MTVHTIGIEVGSDASQYVWRIVERMDGKVVKVVTTRPIRKVDVTEVVRIASGYADTYGADLDVY